MLDESTLRRLSFIRYIYRMAVDQADQPEPYCAVSVLSFHDAIEMFLSLACEYKNVSVPTSINFLQYWEKLDPVLQPYGLSQKRSMTRLDKARGNLKHHGNRPSKEDVDSHRAAARLFFEENTPTVFGTELHRVSLVNFVHPIEARREIEEAVRLGEAKPDADTPYKRAMAILPGLCHRCVHPHATHLSGVAAWNQRRF